jgi:TolB-like protein/Tfp pilus assembly protein PilF
MQVKLPFHVVDLACDDLRTSCGQRVELRPRSYAVLRLLAENAGRLVGKDDIMEKVWDDVAVTEDSLTQCIADIRRAIGDEERRVLRTVSRKGYMLVPAQRAAMRPGRAPDKPSLAVMPFLSIGGGDGTLGVGVATEIIAELARNRDLRLIARDSSFALAGQNLMAQELGERLGARYLVEGSAERGGDELLVDVQLVDAADGTIAWGDRFSALAQDIPRVRREISAKIATSLHAGMREAEKHAILERPPRDLDVFTLTLRGLALKHQFHPDATREGRRDLQEATRRDPNYAPAWAYLAWIDLIDIMMQLTGERGPAHLGDVIEQFNRAIGIDANLPAAYEGLSQALILANEVEQALSLARRAVELGPSDTDALLFLANTLLEAGEVREALEKVEQAVSLNPLPPPYYNYFYAVILWGNERYQEALEQTEECLRKAPSFGGAEIYRVSILVGLGRVREARAALTEFLAKPSGTGIVPPRAPELARRKLAALQMAGWRPTVAADREAV